MIPVKSPCDEAHTLHTRFGDWHAHQLLSVKTVQQHSGELLMTQEAESFAS